MGEQRTNPVITPGAVRFFENVARPLSVYHRHSVQGLEHVPRTGGVLFAMHHSLATYDGFLLGVEVFHATNRLPAGLGDDLIFKIPMLGEWAWEAGIRPALEACPSCSTLGRLVVGDRAVHR